MSKIELKDDMEGHKQILFDLMFRNGIDKVMVYFDGGDDDGSIHDMEAVGPKMIASNGANNWKRFLDIIVEGARIKENCGWSWERGNGKETFTWKDKVTVKDIIYDICYRVLNTKFGGWENDHGSFGEFVIDAQKRKVELTMKQRYYEYDVSLHEL